MEPCLSILVFYSKCLQLLIRKIVDEQGISGSSRISRHRFNTMNFLTAEREPPKSRPEIAKVDKVR